MVFVAYSIAVDEKVKVWDAAVGEADRGVAVDCLSTITRIPNTKDKLRKVCRVLFFFPSFSLRHF
jgi:hypothetical protein